MQTADIFILLIIALPALAGVIYGFLNIVFSILAWILALIITTKFSSAFATLFSGFIDTPILRAALGFISLFILCLVLLTVISFLIVKLLGRTGLTAADRVLGLFFGMALGGVIVLVVVFFAGFTAVPAADWWKNSLVIQPFERISVWAERFLPDSMARYHSYEVSMTKSSALINHIVPVKMT